MAEIPGVYGLDGINDERVHNIHLLVVCKGGNDNGTVQRIRCYLRHGGSVRRHGRLGTLG